MKLNPILLSLVLCVFVLGQFEVVHAQDERDTGRHKPKPRPAVKKTEDKAGKDNAQFYLTFLAGVTKGSNLFQASTLTGNNVPWLASGGDRINSSRFSTKLHHNLVGGLLGRYVYSFGKYNGPAIRFGVDIAEIEILAQSLSGQVGSLVLYDQASVLNVGLGWEYPLADLSAYPYVGAEVLGTFFSPTMSEDLNQANVGGRIVFGYHLHLQNRLALRFEGRLSRSIWEAGSFLPKATLDNQPEINFSAEDHLTFFDFLIGIELDL